MIIRRCDCCHKELDDGYYELEFRLHAQFRRIDDPLFIGYDLCADCAVIVQGVIRKNLSREGKGYDH